MGGRSEEEEGRRVEGTWDGGGGDKKNKNSN